jgi:hypothetical protein
LFSKVFGLRIVAMSEKDQLQQYLTGMHRHLASLDELCEAARQCLVHTQETYATALANAKMHGETLSDVERQRYATLIKEAQGNVDIAVDARETFQTKLRQLEDRIAGV